MFCFTYAVGALLEGMAEYYSADLGEKVPGGIPQIVPEELFDRVQERAKTNKAAPARHKAKEDFILTTKLYCGKCGSYMVGESGTSKTGVTHRYYKCAKAKKDHTCSKKPVKKEWSENLVIEKTKKIIWDDALLERIAERIVALLSEEDATLAALRRQYAEAEKAIDNLLNAMQQGIITSSTKERLQKLETEKEEISIQITKQEIEKPRFSEEQILYFIRQFRELDLSKTAHRRKLIDCFVNAIYLYDDKLVITYNYSRSSETIPLSEITEKENGSDFTATGSPERATSLVDVARSVRGRFEKWNPTVRWTVGGQCAHWSILCFCRRQKCRRVPYGSPKREQTRCVSALVFSRTLFYSA